MKKLKHILFYISVIGGFSFLMYWIVLQGTKLEAGRMIKVASSDKSQWSEFIDTILVNIGHPLAILLAQIVTIILVVRIFAWICVKINQPTVVGEIIAGIILGPSLVGMYFPEFSAVLFPVQSLGNLQFLSQIGLILFMFIVGMEIDVTFLKDKARDAIVISNTSIIIPFALGMGLAYFIYESFAPEGVEFSSFGLFIGIAMSITAFPVLARIVQERGLHKTPLGTVIITSAAVDDISAWSLLAAVIAIVKAGSFVSALYIILLALIYVGVMIKIVSPFLKRVGELHSSRENLSKPIFAIFILTLILSAWATEVIGIHALFGAFMAGAIMPSNAKFRNIFIEKIEDIALVLFLPLFFVYTGLRTEIGLLNDIYLWKVTALIIAVAITGKFVGSALAAKFIGNSWKDSLTIGTLMNTRGLVELVVLNIGYDLGVLTPQIFAMMVIMALFTTFMTGPALDFINWAFKSSNTPIAETVTKNNKFKILISFGKPESGKSLIRLVSWLTKKTKSSVSITVMHLFPSSNMHHYNLTDYENECFESILDESQKLKQEITTFFKVTDNIDNDIAEVANKGNYDLLLIGIGQSIFEGSLLGKILGFTTRIINPDRLIMQVKGKDSLFENSPFEERTRLIVSKTNAPVGILLDKGLSSTDIICVPIVCSSDVFLIHFIQKIVVNSNSKITFVTLKEQTEELNKLINSICNAALTQINVLTIEHMELDFVKNQELMLISLESWKALVEAKYEWLSDIPSTLVIANKHE